MINNRIIHLINTPEDIRALDIENLQKAIVDYPYVQSFRVLYLVALNKFGSKQYQSELALTAAYTTDKKILYQLLNPTHEKPEYNELKEVKNPETDKINLFNAIDNKNILQNEESDVMEISTREPELFLVPKIKVNIPEENILEENQVLERVENENILPNTEEKLNIEVENEIISSTDELTDWNPMDIQISTSDELISKVVAQKEDIGVPKKVDEKIKNDDIENEVLPNKIETIFPIKIPSNDLELTQTNSNVSLFINTWTNWLHKEKPKNYTDSSIEKKEAIISKFIENNPKISAVKENTDYIIKDKGENISHLMTETLAILYLEQKIYTKALDAFKILQDKYPDRSKDFKKKIKYIKDLQSGKIQPKD